MVRTPAAGACGPEIPATRFSARLNTGRFTRIRSILHRNRQHYKQYSSGSRHVPDASIRIGHPAPGAAHARDPYRHESD